MKPTERFSDRASSYRLHRPGYPAAAALLLREACGLPDGASVADIGSGTGFFTRVLLEAGFTVTAVEPNAAMRAAAEEDLDAFPRFRSVGAAAEATGLPGGTYDAVTVAQAFHWFDLEPTRREFRRLLRPGGWAAIVRNERRTDTTPFVREYEELLRSLGTSYGASAHRDRETQARRLRDFFGQEPRIARFDNPQVLDAPGLRGRFLSVSYAPAPGSEAEKEYAARLDALFARHAVGGLVTLDQETEVHYGTLDEEPL